MRELIKKLENAGYKHVDFISEDVPATEGIMAVKTAISILSKRKSEIHLYFNKKIPLSLKERAKNLLLGKEKSLQAATDPAKKAEEEKIHNELFDEESKKVNKIVVKWAQKKGIELNNVFFSFYHVREQFDHHVTLGMSLNMPAFVKIGKA